MIKADHQPDALLHWMGSLADATRLRLLGVLERNELGVSDLCHILQLPQSTVSRHLKLLGDEAWLTSRRQGTTNLYHMALGELSRSQARLWRLVRQQTRDWATFNQDQLRLTRQLRRQQRGSRDFFAGAAGQWDQTRKQMYGEGLTNHVLLGLLPAEWTVADLGCGTGLVTAELARRMKQVIAVDVSQAMLEAARKRTEGLSNVELHHGALESLGLDDGCCDAAVMVIVLSYVAQPRRVLEQMRRILRPGGRAVVVDLMRHDRDDFRRQMNQRCLGFEPGQLTVMLQESGLTAVACHPLPPEQQAKGPALLLATGVAP
ncbi:MAG: metalloregulator ArsR/SmtB family transcription factor [Phycisphaeraceae bacterium]|nr:metalloregulator ArsR/SmtB family transcription factor [Phycisphaeraceae bacterium]